jgi:hypothetical protein
MYLQTKRKKEMIIRSTMHDHWVCQEILQDSPHHYPERDIQATNPKQMQGICTLACTYRPNIMTVT